MKQYIVDAFADKNFEGNPAAVCILEKWPDDLLLLNIAKENNLSETAFISKADGFKKLRWFTPDGEIELCGHATLATAFVLINYIDTTKENVTFSTLSGDLIVTKKNGLFEMVFPAYDLKPVEIENKLTQAIGIKPKEVYLGRDLLCILESEQQVIDLDPDMDKVKELDGLLLQVTAQGSDVDCVSRTFAPKLNVDEDPVCGSGHCHIVPYWAEKLNKDSIIAYQASSRGGKLYTAFENSKVTLSGNVVLYAISDLYI